MTVSQSAPRSFPACVSAANATAPQWLATPVFDFSGAIPARLAFWVRRSSTFGAAIVLDVSTDGGATWSLLAGDTIKADGGTSYQGVSRDIPRGLTGMTVARFRIRVVPAGTGSAGTLRLDDFSLTAHAPYNLALARVTFSPGPHRAGEPVDITACVANTGSLPASGFSVGIYGNGGDTVVPVPGACLAALLPPGQIRPGDSISLNIHVEAMPEGVNSLVAAVRDSADRDTSDNVLSFEVDVVPSPGSIVINEIMYAPLAGEAEYVELAACGSSPVSLKGWRLVVKGSAGSKDKVLVIGGAPFLSAGGFGVIAEDSSVYRFFPALAQGSGGSVTIPPAWETRLNNDGATLLLVDPWGGVADSVAYSPSWHNPSVTDRSGRSLERILAPGGSNDPGNWSTCVLPDGGTPGRRNSVALARRTSPGVVTAFPNPFSPDGDGHDDASVIRYALPAGVWGVSVRIFDARGRLVRTLATNAPSTGSGECIWDGRDDERLTARMGIYVIYVEAIDAVRKTMLAARGVVVLARRLR